MQDRLQSLRAKAKAYARPSDLMAAIEKDSGLRNEISSLSRYFLKRSVSGCGNCHFDACMELIHLKNQMETKFKLLRGVVLYDPIALDAGRILTAANCTEELALYHLKFNPACRKHFYELPDDVDEQIKNYRTGTPRTKAARAKKEASGADGTAAADGETAPPSAGGKSGTAAADGGQTA
jgi:hypothetical protein